MDNWELHDGTAQAGPFDEAHVLRKIQRGIPAATVVRRVGETEWKSLRSHAPFAIALGQVGAAPAPPPAPAPVYVDAPPILPFSETPSGASRGVRAVGRWFAGLPRDQQVVIGGVLVGAGAVLVAVLWAGTSSRPVESVVSKSNPFPPAAEQAPPAPAPTPEPLPAPPATVKPGTWAKIPRPGDDAPDTGANRVRYMANVAQVVQGEPPINKVRAKQLLLRLRAEMAKQASVPVSAIEVNVGDGSGSVTVATGTMGGLLIRGQPQSFGACSEMFFASSIVIAGLGPEEFAKAGVRSVLCKSDGCVGIFDMRPTSPGGGIYGGTSCLSLGDALRLEGLRVPE